MLDKVLEYNFDHIVFLGDYFDCFPHQQGRADPRTWVSMLHTVYQVLGSKATWLVGNHDLPYIEVYPKTSEEIDKAAIITPHPGFTPLIASILAEYQMEDFLFGLELCTQVDKYIISHAGFHPKILPPFKYKYPRTSIKKLYTTWEQQKRHFHLNVDHWINQVGPVRAGGNSKYAFGSPVWLDWFTEFEDIEGCPQIVGHAQVNAYLRGLPYEPLKKGKSLCIDLAQSGYASFYKGKLTWHDLF